MTFQINKGIWACIYDCFIYKKFSYAQTGAIGPQGIQGEVGLKGDSGLEESSFSTSAKAMFIIRY